MQCSLGGGSSLEKNELKEDIVVGEGGAVDDARRVRVYVCSVCGGMEEISVASPSEVVGADVDASGGGGDGVAGGGDTGPVTTRWPSTDGDGVRSCACVTSSGALREKKPKTMMEEIDREGKYGNEGNGDVKDSGRRKEGYCVSGACEVHAFD